MEDDPPDTRLFVSGLPPNFTDRDLGKHFAGRFQITDAQVIPGRRIGFVGFRNYTLAKNALAWFDRSYIRMSKIHVEFAKPAQQLGSFNTQHRPPDPKALNASQLSVPGLDDTVSAKSRPVPSPLQSGENAHSIYQPWVPVVRSASSKSKAGSGGESLDKERVQNVRGSVNEPGLAKKNVSNSGEEESVSEQRKKRKRPVTESQQAFDSVERSKERRRPEKEYIGEGEVRSPAQDGASAEEHIAGKRKRSKDARHVFELPEDGREKQGKKTKKTKRKASFGQDQKGGVETPHEDMPVIDDQGADQNQLDNPTDDDWLRSKTSRLLGLDDADDLKRISGQISNNIEHVVDADEELAPLRGGEDDSLKSTASVIDSTARLFLRNLPFDATESEIRDAFSRFGILEEIHVVRDAKTNTSRGLAYVEFQDVASAKIAMESMDGKSFQGRLLHVLPASGKRQHALDDFALSKLPLKKQKLLKQKSQLNGSKTSWNFLYMDPDAVLSSVAERLGASKADILDPTSSDAAVKQALAETHVIQENQTYFAAHGVNLKSFEKGEKGGKSLLVKSFPYGTTTEDLKNLLEECGKVEKLLMPPSGVIAIAQFTDRPQAQRALKHFAYKNFRGSVLFLEQAPKHLFAATEAVPEPSHASDKNSTIQMDTSVSNPQQASTLFIRNLNFTTTTVDLVTLCGSLEGFLSARVKTKSDPRRPGETLSMGYGFAEFGSHAHAEAALKALDEYNLDGHRLTVRFAQRPLDMAEERREGNQARTSNAPKTKIIIKNLPFEATKKDISSLFGPYGQLRSVRVPKKFDRSTRGFAFADFVTAKEAENARLALKDTHLLGRRLVLEFAVEDSVDPEAEIQAIEKKVGEQTETINLRKKIGPGRKRFNADGQDDIA